MVVRTMVLPQYLQRTPLNTESRSSGMIKCYVPLFKND